MIVGAERLLSAAQPSAAAAFAGRTLVCGQLLDAGALIFVRRFMDKPPRLDVKMRPASRQLRSALTFDLPAAFVLLGKAYPSNDAPGVEVARELALVFVARDQYDDAPIVDILEVEGGCGADQIHLGPLGRSRIEEVLGGPQLTVSAGQLSAHSLHGMPVVIRCHL